MRKTLQLRSKCGRIWVPELPHEEKDNIGESKILMQERKREVKFLDFAYSYTGGGRLRWMAIRE